MFEQETPKCCGEVISNTVNGKDFYFCRGCRKEVGYPALQDPPKDDDDEFMPWGVFQQGPGTFTPTRQHYLVGTAGAGGSGRLVNIPPAPQVKCTGCPIGARLTACSACDDAFNKNINTHKWSTQGAFRSPTICNDCGITEYNWHTHLYADCATIQSKATKRAAPVPAHPHDFSSITDIDYCTYCGHAWKYGPADRNSNCQGRAYIALHKANYRP